MKTKQHQLEKQQTDATATSTSDTVAEPESYATLHLSGDHVHLSEAFPIEEKDSLIKFLLEKESQRLLYGAGGTKTSEFIPTTKEFEDLWEITCNEYFGDEVKEEGFDNLITCESKVNFPGLHMTLHAVNAMKYTGVKDITPEGLPMLKSFLIAEKQEISGLKPMKWVFNSLTGNDKKPQGVYIKPMGNAVADSTVVYTDDGKNVVVQLKMKFDIAVHFSATLIKILPMSKEKLEKQVSSSVLKTVKKDMKDSVTAFVKTYKEQRNN